MQMTATSIYFYIGYYVALDVCGSGFLAAARLDAHSIYEKSFELMRGGTQREMMIALTGKLFRGDEV